MKKEKDSNFRLEIVVLYIKEIISVKVQSKDNFQSFRIKKGLAKEAIIIRKGEISRIYFRENFKAKIVKVKNFLNIN